MHTMKLSSEIASRLSHLQLERLPAISHRERTLVPLSCTRETFVTQQRCRFLFQLTENFPEFADVLRSIHHRAALVFDHVSNEDTDRRERTWSCRRDDRRDSQCTRQIDGVQTTGAAKWQQRKLSRIVTALD